ncbi:MAG: ATP-binding protein [Acidimicrobiia bacterium]|nr:ATP-binding protein [Acidimicrobiia bacterium]
MGVIRSIILAKDHSELIRLGEWVAATADRLGLDESLAFKVDLCLVEAVTNVIDYGFKDDGEHEIVVFLESDGPEVSVLVEDDGRAFNPLKARDPKLATSLDEVTIGGLGIHLFKTYTQDLRYERKGGKNRLTLIFERGVA